MYALILLLHIATLPTYSSLEFEPMYNIPIMVVETFPLPYAPDIQDISFNPGNSTIAVRSNGAGKIFIVDHFPPHSLLDDLDLPTNCSGFGLGVSETNTFYVNSDSVPLIYYSTGAGWGEYVNPAGTQGAGMDCYSSGLPLVTQLSINPSHQLYAFDPNDSTSVAYPFTGVTDEISGYMAHDVMTETIYPPFATISTTRFGHEFYFHYLNSSSEYYVYGQEPTPIPVSESLGLSWIKYTDLIYWSYIGTDLECYISILQLPIFGSIEDSQSPIYPQPHLQIDINPSSASASLTVNTISTVQARLIVFDVYGRRVDVLFDGSLTTGTNSFSFTGPPGVYIGVLQQSDEDLREEVRFVLTE